MRAKSPRNKGRCLSPGEGGSGRYQRGKGEGKRQKADLRCFDRVQEIRRNEVGARQSGKKKQDRGGHRGVVSRPTKGRQHPRTGESSRL